MNNLLSGYQKGQRAMSQKPGQTAHQTARQITSGAGQYPRFRQRHPVLTPTLFLGAAALLCIGSVNSSLFPLLALWDASSRLFCLSLAFALGTSGILVCIINGIEYFDRHNSQSMPGLIAFHALLNMLNMLFRKLKEHSYASN